MYYKGLFKYFITLQGLPAAIQSEGISFDTTLPPPIIEREPIVTPFNIILLVPISTSSLIFIDSHLGLSSIVPLFL